MPRRRLLQPVDDLPWTERSAALAARILSGRGWSAQSGYNGASWYVYAVRARFITSAYCYADLGAVLKVSQALDRIGSPRERSTAA